MDSAAILSSLTQSPPRGGGVAGGDMVAAGMAAATAGPAVTDLSTSDPNTQRKITLLTRPTPPVVGNTVSSTSTVGVASIIVSGEGNPLISDLPQAIGGGGVVLSDTLPTTGRAARNDYFDTEDPSVNLHEFIVNSLQAQKNRVVLLKLEEEFLTYVTDPKRVDPLKLPPWDSYHRMLAHRVAAYFGLEHNVDPVDKSCVVVCKGPQTRVPIHRFSDFLAVDPDSDSAEPKHILKRSSRDTVSALEKSYEVLANLTSDVKSFEQREEEYEKARARIFNQQPLHGSRSNIAFDLGSAPQRTRSSLLPAIMQHRRTVSDTLLFRRPSLLEDIMKESPSSNHSSRSATPLIALLPPTGDGTIVGQAIVGQGAGSKVAGIVTSQHSPQQQKIASRELPASQAQVTQQHIAIRPPSKHSRQRPANVPSFQFQPLAQRGVPVFYPPQQAAIMTDPSWYYNNMMLYQVSPQQFIPAAAATGSPYGQVIQPALFPVNQQYPISPGVVPAQSPVISPPISTRPGPHMRLPMVSPMGTVVDGGVPSPSQLPSGGVTLVRPVAQVATPTRGSFKFDVSPTSALAQPQAYPTVGGAILSGGSSGGGASGQHPHRALLAGAGGAGQLAEQMEQLALDGRRGIGGGSVVGESGEVRAGQIGEGGRRQGAYDGSRNGGKSAVLNGSFPPAAGYAMMSAIEAGQMISPTQVHPATAMQFVPAHMQHPHIIAAGAQEPQLVSPQHVPPGTPGGVVHFPGSLTNQSPSAPTTPPIGHMGFSALPSMFSAQQPQTVFSPPSTGVTHSPVQILGHTLGTSLFSPPPSSTTHPGMFVNSPTTGGKVIGYPTGSPAHAPVGSGLRFRRFESPKQGSHVSEVSPSVPLAHGQSSSGTSGLSQVQFMPENPVPQPQPQKQLHKGNNGTNGGGNLISSSSGFQPVQLPPRLASQQQASTTAQRNTGTRYQNQRHPANRGTQGTKVGGGGNGNGGGGGGLVSEPGQFLQLTGKKEPLLPTPPNTQMVKLDTTLTCGVPLHVMEIVSLPPDGSPERQHAYQLLREVGALDITGGRINKTGEEVLIASFPSPDMAIKALQMHNMPFTLSIPRNNHAKFILSLLQNTSVQ